MKNTKGIIRSNFLLAAVLITVTATAAIGKDSTAIQFVKTLIAKANSGNGYINAIRFFQYTATQEKNNPSSFILSKWGKEALAESGLEVSDRGRFISVLADRSGVRIEKLWKENREDLLKLLSAEAYNEILRDEVNSLIEFRNSRDYASMIKKMKARSKKPGVKTIDHAGAVTGWSGYKQLAFWYRRINEKNDKIVFDILREMQSYYAVQ